MQVYRPHSGQYLCSNTQDWLILVKIFMKDVAFFIIRCYYDMQYG